MFRCKQWAWALTLAALLLPVQAAAGDFPADVMKRMSVFLSNFTEIGMLDFDAKTVLDVKNPGDMIRFGIWHNYVNNYKSRIKPCTTKDCQWGSLTIDGNHVKESLRRYFAYDLKQCPTVEQSDPPYHFDGKRYHFAGADGEAVYHARVDQAKKLADGLVEMRGVVYNADDKSAILGDFTALARPHTWQNKNTWAIVHLKTHYRE